MIFFINFENICIERLKKYHKKLIHTTTQIYFFLQNHGSVPNTHLLKRILHFTCRHFSSMFTFQKFSQFMFPLLLSCHMVLILLSLLFRFLNFLSLFFKKESYFLVDSLSSLVITVSFYVSPTIELAQGC